MSSNTKIQKNFSSVEPISSKSMPFNESNIEHTKQSKSTSPEIFRIIRKFLFLLQPEKDEQRFFNLCEFLLKNAEAESSAKVSLYYCLYVCFIFSETIGSTNIKLGTLDRCSKASVISGLMMSQLKILYVH